MLETQKKYISYLTDVDTATQDIDIFSLKNIEEIKSNIRDTELIIPVVGGFSAGKSTLINSYLQIDVLPTGITPETALATELRYSNSEYIEAVKSDYSIDKYKINQSEAIKNNASKYKYIKLYLNNQKLKQIEPLILVDMPGFASPLELHSQAILNYLSKGIYFIVLTSVEEGNIQKSTMRELENITEFGKGFSFCLSKVNLKGTSDVSEIKEKIKKQIDDSFECKQDVIQVSNNGGQELENILIKIDSEKLFEKIFLDDLKNNHVETINSIGTIISTLKASKEESADAIKELQESMDKIISKKINMIEEEKSKYTDDGVNGIVEAVGSELKSNMENLTTMALSKSDDLSREINDIIKNTIIIEMQNKMQDTSSSIVDNFSIEIKNMANSLDNFDLGDKWVNTISESTKNLIKNAQNGLKTVMENRDTSSKRKGYRFATTILGLTTKVISPLLEVVIVFLPDIISSLTAKSREAKERAKVSDKLSSEIIPSIKSKIRSVLPKIYNEQVHLIIETISNQFEKQIEIKEQEITKIQEAKETTIKDDEAEINKFNNIKKELVRLAQESLYQGGVS